MSTEDQNTAGKAEKPKMGIIERVMARLGLGDSGRIASFYSKLKKDLANQIADRKFNIERQKSLTEREVEKLQGQLEDAKEDLETCYENVTPADVETSIKAESFKTTFYERIENQQERVDSLKKQIAEIKLDLKNYEDNLTVEIKEFQARLNKLNELK